MSAPTVTSPDRATPRPARSRRLVLVACPDPSAPRERELGPGVFELGREVPDGGLRLGDPELSRRHARVTVGAEVRLEDLGSRNGVFVDGARVREVALAPGAVIRIGQTLLVHVDDEVPAGVPLVGELPRLRGGSLAMQRVRGELTLAATRSVPVLVLGETGVGKERIAEELHRQSGRAGRWIAVNCAALPAALAESELFGHVAGAFTGAVTRHEGLFAAAAGGTIFLDEVGELPPPLQAKLLRVLASGEVRPVGSAAAVAVDARVVAATHRAIDRADGDFREDLRARLAGWVIRVPPLRDRRDDILDLAVSFDSGAIDVGAAEALLLHDWPGNVRELEQTLTRARILAGDGAIALLHLPEAVRAARPATTPPTPRPAGLEDVDRTEAPSAGVLHAVLERHQGNVAAVARFFGKDRRQIYRWMERHGLAASTSGTAAAPARDDGDEADDAEDGRGAAPPPPR